MNREQAQELVMLLKDLIRYEIYESQIDSEYQSPDTKLEKDIENLLCNNEPPKEEL